MQEEVVLARDHGLEHNGFVIVDAGNCSYETKARNIQNMGAKVAIIIENDNDMSEVKGETVEDFITGPAGPYDGTSSSVYIPTLLINRDDGEKIKQLFHDDPAVQLQLKVEFELPKNAANKVTYELFYGSILDLPSSLILDLYEW